MPSPAPVQLTLLPGAWQTSAKLTPAQVACAKDRSCRCAGMPLRIPSMRANGKTKKPRDCNPAALLFIETSFALLNLLLQLQRILHRGSAHRVILEAALSHDVPVQTIPSVEDD